MTTTAVGNLSLSTALPGAAAAAAAGEAGINGALPDIEARIAAFAAFTPTLTDFAAQIQLCNDMIASINAAIAVGITPPDISAQLSIVAAQLAALEAIAVSVNANLTIVLDFIGLLVNAGLHVYHYNGQIDSMGAEATTEFSGGLPGGSGPTEVVNALWLITSVGATWTAMQDIFKTAP